MLIALIPYVLLAASLLGLAVMIYRKMPALASLSKTEMAILGKRKGVFRKMREINYKQYWLKLVVRLEKTLRKLKIIFLKIENLLTKWIEFLRRRSQLTTQRSREWMKQREEKKREKPKIKGWLIGLLKRKKDVSVKINESETMVVRNDTDIDDDLPISELEKPIQEEQKWIDLIVANPKNITAYKFLGLLYWEQHNYADAKASLEMAVKLGSKDKRVREILEQLEKVGVEEE